MGYLKTLRFNTIRHLLSNTDLTVGEIGAQCGIPDVSYLCKLFKQRYRMTPLKFRKASAKSIQDPIPTVSISDADKLDW